MSRKPRVQRTPVATWISSLFRDFCGFSTIGFGKCAKLRIGIQSHFKSLQLGP